MDPILLLRLSPSLFLRYENHWPWLLGVLAPDACESWLPGLSREACDPEADLLVGCSDRPGERAGS